MQALAALASTSSHPPGPPLRRRWHRAVGTSTLTGGGNATLPPYTPIGRTEYIHPYSRRYGDWGGGCGTARWQLVLLAHETFQEHSAKLT